MYVVMYLKFSTRIETEEDNSSYKVSSRVSMAMRAVAFQMLRRSGGGCSLLSMGAMVVA